MPRRFFLSVLFLTLLAACAPTKPWQPTIDTGNDRHIDTLKPDLAACKYFAEQAAENSVTPRTRSLQYNDDIAINGSVFRRAYTNCMKERHHPVLD